MDNGKAVAHASNLQYGQRFNASLPDGIYKVQVYNRETGKLIDTFNLAHSTDHKDNDLTVTLRLPNTSLTPAPTVRYQVREE